MSPILHARHYLPEVLGPLGADPRHPALIREVDVQWGLDPDGSLPPGDA